MDKERTEELVYTVQETRRLLRLSRGLVYEAIRSGEIPSLKIGRRILVPAAGLARLLAVETADVTPLGNERQDKVKRK